jgi:hypothetical protein
MNAPGLCSPPLVVHGVDRASERQIPKETGRSLRKPPPATMGRVHPVTRDCFRVATSGLLFGGELGRGWVMCRPD